MTADRKINAERALGALWGVAVGDALGATVEFMTPEAIKNRHGIHTEILGGGAFKWRPGQGTDDTDLTFAVLKAYVDEPFPTPKSFADNLLEWYRKGPRDIGGTTSRALQAVARGDDPRTTGLTSFHSQGNGSLMRAIPTAIFHAHNMDHLIADSKMISAITHARDACVWACVAYNQLAAALLMGQNVEEALAFVGSDAARRAILVPEVEEALKVDPSTPVEDIPTSGWVIDSLRAAVWAIQQPTSFEDTLVALVNRGDDADTTGAIAGGLLGAAKGAEAIPQRWLDVIEYRDILAECLHSRVPLSRFATS